MSIRCCAGCCGHIRASGSGDARSSWSPTTDKPADLLAVIAAGRLAAEGTPSALKAADRGHLRLQGMLVPKSETPLPRWVKRHVRVPAHPHLAALLAGRPGSWRRQGRPSPAGEARTRRRPGMWSWCVPRGLAGRTASSLPAPGEKAHGME